ncbi:hypothetical protein MKW98_017236 [Papaver atlanticum]|uniref:Uncharacterized protein n=1 Tax=Papaver atlanticum TaxID=357466 RepID=A0AAD4S5D9_9MAGN|nr:hypothetical protein MKW98_017236 [Papaver atlanticum]
MITNKKIIDHFLNLQQIITEKKKQEVLLMETTTITHFEEQQNSSVYTKLKLIFSHTLSSLSLADLHLLGSATVCFFGIQTLHLLS